MHYGDNGILRGAEYAVDKYQNKAEQEQNELAKVEEIIKSTRTEDNKIIENQYSTEEKVIGRWIDNKPIYQKTYVLKNLSGNTQNVVIIDENAKNYVDTFVHSEFRMTRNVANNPQLASSYDFNTTDNFAEIWYTDQRGFYIYGAFAFPVSECHVTVQYTKVTDK